MLNGMKKFLRDEEGASAVEYALIAGLIAVVLIAAVTLMNGGFNSVFGGINTALQDATPGGE